jgi:hypothetical protein
MGREVRCVRRLPGLLLIAAVAGLLSTTRGEGGSGSNLLGTTACTQPGQGCLPRGSQAPPVVLACSRPSQQRPQADKQQSISAMEMEKGQLGFPRQLGIPRRQIRGNICRQLTL